MDRWRELPDPNAWDARTVTHILGVRAFGTQLLCEQVVGRALRRQSYDANEDGLFDVEYADVLGIPFDFTARPARVKPPPPRETCWSGPSRPSATPARSASRGWRTYPAQLMYQELADMACERITARIVSNLLGERPIKAMLDPYNPVGSTLHVRFTISKKRRWETDPGRCHINWVVCGRWAFAELADVSAMEADFEGALKAQFQALVERVTS